MASVRRFTPLTVCPTDERYSSRKANHCRHDRPIRNACSRRRRPTNRIVGYSIGERMTAQLAVSALRSAIARRQPQGTVIVHADRGGQFRSRAFRATLKANGLTGSMGRVASAADNAAMESFYALLQKNVLNRRRVWRTRAELRYEIVVWIEHTYNRRRRQRGLGRLTPSSSSLPSPPRRPASRTTPKRHDQSEPPSTRRAADPFSPVSPHRCHDCDGHERDTRTYRGGIHPAAEDAGAVEEYPQSEAQRRDGERREVAGGDVADTGTTQFVHVNHQPPPGSSLHAVACREHRDGSLPAWPGVHVAGSADRAHSRTSVPGRCAEGVAGSPFAIVYDATMPPRVSTNS